jgi:hypothetical protein
MLVIRPPVSDDVPLLKTLIHEVAKFEQAFVTEESLLRDGFGSQPKFRALIAEWNSQPVGYALFLDYYASFQGRGEQNRSLKSADGRVATAATRLEKNLVRRTLSETRLVENHRTLGSETALGTPEAPPLVKVNLLEPQALQQTADSGGSILLGRWQNSIGQRCFLQLTLRLLAHSRL